MWNNFPKTTRKTNCERNHGETLKSPPDTWFHLCSSLITIYVIKDIDWCMWWAWTHTHHVVERFMTMPKKWMFFLFCDEVWVYVCYVWGTGQVGASVMYTTRTLFTGQHRLDNRRCNFCQNSILISRKLRFVYPDYFVGGTWGFAINSIFRHQEGLIHLSGSTLVREIITCTDVSMYRSLISWMIDNISYYRVFSMRKA